MKALARLCLFLALGLPSLICEPHALHAFEAPQLMALRLLAPLAFLMALAWRWTNGPAAPDASLQRGRTLLILLIGLWICSALFHPDRADLSVAALSQWLAYPMLFLATWWLSDTAKERSKLVGLLLLLGALQAAYGLCQSAGWNPFAWSTQFDSRAGGFLGNPNFLGGHLALLLPLAVAAAMEAGTAAWILAGLILAGLVATQTRGAWIGAAAGLALVLWLKPRVNRKALAILAGCGLGIAILFATLHPDSIQRLASGEELARRGVLMRASSSLALQHPMLGVGPGQFRIQFPSVQAVGLDSQNPRPYISSEHAHNDFIQMAADAGLPALLVYLSLLVWLFRKLGKGTGEQAWLAAGCLGGIVALEVHGLANFPFLIGPTQATAWAMGALGLASMASVTSASTVPPQAMAARDAGRSAQAKEVPKLSGSQIMALLAGFLLLGLGAFQAERVFTQEMLWWVGQGESKLGDYSLGEPKLSKALRLNPDEDRLWYQRGLTQLGLRNNANASDSFGQAVRLNPHYCEARLAWGKTLLALGLSAQAEAALEPAALDAPNFAEVWEPLGASLFMQQKYPDAIAAYNHALALNQNPVSVLGNKAAALGSLGNLEQALQCLQQAQGLDPSNPQVQLNLAVTYIKMGNKPQARLALQRARQLDPSNAQLGSLMKALR